MKAGFDVDLDDSTEGLGSEPQEPPGTPGTAVAASAAADRLAAAHAQYDAVALGEFSVELAVAASAGVQGCPTDSNPTQLAPR